MDYQKLFESGVNQEAVKAWRAQGKKAIGYICCHVPVEILEAMDILPVRLRATDCTESPDADTWMSTFSCSHARGMLQYWMNGTYELDGLITSDGCMMAARCFDNAEYQDKNITKKNKFFKEIGAPRMYKTNSLALAYYVEEIKDLIKGLEDFTGTKLDNDKLKTAIEKHNEVRALIREIYALRKAEKPVINGEDCLKITLSYGDYPVDEYIEMLKAFLADAKNRAPVEGARARLMLIGSAMDNPGYLKVIEDKGGLFVTDAICHGSRPFAHDLEINGDLIESIATYYLSRILCPRMLDNRPELQKMIVDACKEYNVDGVIYQKMQYCECWGGESLYLEPDLKAIGVPMLQVEREEHLANAGQLAIRAEAFVEMIEK